VVVTDEPLKSVKDADDISVAMKFEVYPNRDSMVFLERFGMQDCETFVRGTVRYKGFSSIISSFHDLGITSDDLVPQNAGIKNLKDLTVSRFSKVQKHSLDSHK